jgi:prepilin-type N-terminal cleavage/methylation domain-containing protein
MRRPGYTLIELLTVIGVASILLAAGIPAMQSLRQNASLGGTTTEIVSRLRQTQSLAVASVGNTDHRVQFSANQYSVDGQVTKLPYDVTISSGAGTVIFKRLTGTIAAPYTLTVRLSTGSTRTVTISPAGVVSQS